MAHRKLKLSKNQKIILTVAIILLLIAAFFVKAYFDKSKVLPEYNKNLLSPISIENSLWESDAYLKDPSISSFEVLDESGEAVLHLINSEFNDARFMQYVDVLPNTLYVFEGEIMAKAEGGLGANLSVADVYAFSESVFDSGDSYTKVQLYGRTGENQKSLILFARLGGYSGEAKGWASFKNLAFYAIEEAPKDVNVEKFYKTQSTSNEANPFYPYMLLIALLSVPLYYFATNKNSSIKAKNSFMPLAFILFFALVLRLLIANLIPGYDVDIACFTSWSGKMIETGPSNFYLGEGHSDYPPGYMLVLWLLGGFAKLFGLQINEFLVKLPPIFIDLVSITLLYNVARKKSSDFKAFALSLLYALSPLIVLTGAGWGQVDSFTALSLVLAVLYAFDKKWNYVFPIYVVSMLIKPQALMFGPIGLLAVIVELFKADTDDRKKQLKSAGLGFLYSLVLALAVIIPFSVKMENPFWIFDLYGKTLNFYNRATINYLNPYFLFNLNWVGVDAKAPILLKLVVSLVFMLGFIRYALTKHKYGQFNKSFVNKMLPFFIPFVIFLILLSILPIDLSHFGTAFMALSFLIIAYQYIKAGSIKALPLYAALLLFLFANTGTMMHERYLYPAVLLLSFALVYKHNKSVALLLLFISLTTFLNVGIVLDRNIRIGGYEGHLSAPAFGIASDSKSLEYLLAFLNTIAISFVVSLGFINSDKDLHVEKSKESQDVLAKLSNPSKENKQKFRPSKLDIKDLIIVIVMCIVYSFVAFYQLGTNIAPKTDWTSKDMDDEVVFDLGEVKSVNLIFYPGVVVKHGVVNQFYYFNVDSSYDSQNWKSYETFISYADCFTWVYLREPMPDDISKRQPINVTLNGRYIRLSNVEAGLNLFEIVFRDIDSGENLKVKALSERDIPLVDESDVLKGESHWYNSMYFDEIYHGRTAYEQMLILTTDDHDNIYETTHPPLGKVLMTFSVMAFGMSPFGWRFAGVVAGILMLPGIYLMARLFTKKRLSSIFAILFMAFDFMHYTQTRIATIDSFATMFIIYSLYFMFRYALIHSESGKLKGILVNLFLSGLFFGLACASKWTGFYAGIGLAIIFFVSFIRAIIKGFTLEKEDNLSEDDIKYKKGYKKQGLIILLSCVIFFIIIPLIVYTLSFYPVFKNTRGGLSLQKVIDSSQHMLNYHAKEDFGADHPYSSKWYSWPITQKPMWYYSGTRVNGTGSTMFAFGNPVVWFFGLASILSLIYFSFVNYISRHYKLSKFSSRLDSRVFLIIVAFLTQYLPWALVPRGTYIYHYFPSIPFIILASAYIVELLLEKNYRLIKWLVIGLIALSALAFVIFFPYISGIRVSFDYLNLALWYPGIWY